MEEAWRNLTTTNAYTRPNWPLVCCDIRMTIEEDTSAQSAAETFGQPFLAPPESSSLPTAAGEEHPTIE